MRISFIFILLVASILSGASVLSGSTSRASENEPPLVELVEVSAPPGQTIANRINVLFRPGTSPAAIAQLNAANAAVLTQPVGPSGVHSLQIPAGASVSSILQAYRNHPLVLEAGPAQVVQLFAEPDDTNYGFQWHLHDTAGGIWAEKAWNLAPSAGAGVTVAVIDTGAPFESFTRAASPGLPEMVFSPAPDLAGTNFVAPWNFVHDDAHPNDDHGHGSHVIGTIRQTTNNAYGVAGVAHGANIMPIKVLDYQGSGQDTDLNDAIVYATDQGADIISMSLGFPGTGAPDGNGVVCGEIVGLNAAIDYAAANGVVLVAAAGNDGGTTVSCPAANPNVIAVGATRFDAQVPSYSNRGSELDVVAPGGDPNVDQNSDGFSDGVVQETYCLPGSFIILQGIFSGTAIFDGFCDVFMSGTSMATPHVAGIAALLLGEDSSLSPAQVRCYLESTARDGGVAGWDTTFGWGLVDANAALIALTGVVPPTPTATATPVPPTATATAPPPTATATPTPPATADDHVYVSSITFESRSRGRGGAVHDERITVLVRRDSDGDGIAEETDELLRDASVTLTFAGLSISGTTNGGGQFRTKWVTVAGSGTYVAQVIDVSLTGLTWNMDMGQQDSDDPDNYPDASHDVPH